MLLTIADLSRLFTEHKYNPSLIMGVMCDAINSTSDKELTLLDPNNPFVWSLQSIAAGVAAHNEEAFSLTRRQNPNAAQTYDEVYLHLTQRDYQDVFAQPSTAYMYMLFSMDELYQKMVWEEATGNRKMVIPRNTSFTVGGATFSIQYPVEITLLQHGGVKAIYLTDDPSPLKTLVTNEVPFTIHDTPNGQMLMIKLDVEQFQIQTTYIPIDLATGALEFITVPDQFYTARCYAETSDKKWVEIQTTHRPEIFNPTELTVALQLTGNILTVRLPQIYVSRGMLTSNLRVDVYSTKGDFRLHLGAYGLGAFEVNYKNIDANDNTKYNAPLTALGDTQIISDASTIGGRGLMSFTELKRRAITNALGGFNAPITPIQLDAELTDMGYSVVTHIDNITDRLYLATRELPNPTAENSGELSRTALSRLITASAATIQTITSSLEILSAMEGVYNNGDSVTLTPNTIYQNVGGITQVVPSDALRLLLSNEPDRLAQLVTTGSYYYTPFHYVLDARNNEFETRAYYLDEPVINSKAFIDTNATTGMGLTTKDYQIERLQNGYRLTIVATHSGNVLDNLNDIYLQLAFVPSGDKNMAYMTTKSSGKNKDGNLLFEFNIVSNFDLNKKDQLILNSFKMYDDEARKLPCDLIHRFHLIYSSTSVMPREWLESDMEPSVGRYYIPSLKVAAITHEVMELNFGKALRNLWTRARTVPSDNQYARYETDILDVYEEDIYYRDPLTGSILQIVDGKPVYQIIHKKGDPKLDKDGKPRYRHRKGDVILDENKQPVIKASRNLFRQFDIMLLEGPYWFSNLDVTKQYRKDVVNTLLNWITVDLATLSKRTLEKTTLAFYPRSTIGLIDVMVANGRQTRIQAGQSLQVNLLVPDSVERNPELKNHLRTLTIQTIADALNAAIVSHSAIIALLRYAYGNDVYDIQLTGLGGNNLPAFTVITPGAKASIRKRLVVQGNNGLMVEDDVTVTFSTIGK